MRHYLHNCGTRLPNRGESPQYHFADTHPAIIPRDVFEKAQILLKQKTDKFCAEQRLGHLFTNLLYCGNCGTAFYHRSVKGSPVWICGKHYRDAASCPTGTIAESQLIGVYQKMLWKLQRNDCELLKYHLEMLSKIQMRSQNQEGKHQYITEIASLLEQSHTLHRLWTTGCVDSDFFYAKEQELQKAIFVKRDMLQRSRIESEKALSVDCTKDILQNVKFASTDCFDKDSFTHIVQRMSADNKQVVFTLKNGLKLCEYRDETI